MCVEERTESRIQADRMSDMVMLVQAFKQKSSSKKMFVS